MITISFMTVAFVCFLCAVIFPFTTINTGRLNLIALGLMFMALAGGPLALIARMGS